MAKKLNYGTMGGNQWEELLLDQPELAAECHWNRLSGDNWVSVLRAHPEWAEHCDWSKLEGSHWARLLARQPQFADCCPWEKLSHDETTSSRSSCWPDLLVAQPQFADNCDWDSIEDHGWRKLLEERPEFAEKCDWSKFTGYQSGYCLKSILKSQPQLESICDWDAISGDCIADLLKEYPEYAGHCDFSKLSSEDWIDADWDGDGLLVHRPQFAEKCYCWSQFTAEQWAALLKHQPGFANRCDKWSGIDIDDWVKMLLEQPSLAIYFSAWDKISASQWTELIVKHPEFSKKCESWETFSICNWHEILRVEPMLFGKCDKWKDLNHDAYAWKKLVEVQPQLADFRNARKKGESVTLYRISIKDDVPTDANESVSQETVDSLVELMGPGKANIFSKFGGETWYHLLKRRPDFAAKSDLSIMDDGDWDSLLEEQPALKKYRPPIEARKLSSFTGASWVKLLSTHPEYERRCAWSKLKDDDDWVALLSAQPQFADRCPWDNFGGEPLAKLLIARPELYSKCHKEYIDGEGWVQILKRHPDFVKNYKALAPKMWLRDKCVVWHSFPDLCDEDVSKFVAWQMVYVLRFCPEYADKCDLSKINGATWSELLDGRWGGCYNKDQQQWKIHKEDYHSEEHPELAPLCAWEKIPADKVWRLIDDYPQYVDRMDLSQCPSGRLLKAAFQRVIDRDADGEVRYDAKGRAIWVEKQHPKLIERIDWAALDGGDWASFLDDHPEYADKCDWSKFDGHDWAGLLRKRPEFADHCEWDLLDDRDWTWLLEDRPEFADMCPFDKLDGGNWDDLLVEQPKLSAYCDWAKLDHDNWCRILQKRPEFIDKCDVSCLDNDDWCSILREQPQLAEKCDKWSEFSDEYHGGGLSSLLSYQPQFADRYDQLPCSGGRDLAELLQQHPELSVKCKTVFADTNSFDGYEWALLLGTPGILNRLQVEAIEVVKGTKPTPTPEGPVKKKAKKSAVTKVRTKKSKNAEEKSGEV